MDPRDRTWAEVNATRRSVVSYTGEVVSRELIREIVDEAALAPSAFNGQPWRFVVVQGDALDRFDEALGGNMSKIRSAGTLVAVFADTSGLDGREGFYDGSLARTTGEWAARNGGIVAMNVLQAAWSHGVGTRPMIGFDAAGLRDAADVPDSWHPVLSVAMGWPADEDLPPRSRRPVDEVLRFLD
jgi:nitroreductase